MSTRSRISSKNAYKNNLSTLDDVDLSNARDGAIISLNDSADKIVSGAKITISPDSPSGGTSGDIWFRIEQPDGITVCEKGLNETDLTISTTYGPQYSRHFWNSYPDQDNILNSTFSSLLSSDAGNNNVNIIKDVRNINNDPISQVQQTVYKMSVRQILYSDLFIHTPYESGGHSIAATEMKVINVETGDEIEITNPTNFQNLWSGSLPANATMTKSGDVWAFLTKGDDYSQGYVCKLEGNEFAIKYNIADLPDYGTYTQWFAFVQEDISTGDIFLIKSKETPGSSVWDFYKLDSNGTPLSPNAAPKITTSDSNSFRNNIFIKDNYLIFESLTGNNSYKTFQISDWISEYNVDSYCNTFQTGSYTTTNFHDYAMFIWLGDEHLIGKRQYFDGDEQYFPGLFHAIYST